MGKHKNQVRRISGMTTEEFGMQQTHAANRGQSWAEWARHAMSEQLRRETAREKKSQSMSI